MPVFLPVRPEGARFYGLVAVLVPVGETSLPAGSVGAVVAAEVGASVAAMVGAVVTVAAPEGVGDVVFWLPVLFVQAVIENSIAQKMTNVTAFFMISSLYYK